MTITSISNAHPRGSNLFKIPQRTPFKDEGTYNIDCVDSPMEGPGSIMQGDGGRVYLAPLRM